MHGVHKKIYHRYYIRIEIREAIFFLNKYPKTNITAKCDTFIRDVNVSTIIPLTISAPRMKVSLPCSIYILLSWISPVILSIILNITQTVCRSPVFCSSNCWKNCTVLNLFSFKSVLKVIT